ncbi:MAG TPA: hypothetical protein VF172_13730 [Nitrososphaera sp.]|jgi:hypothetical protein
MNASLNFGKIDLNTRVFPSELVVFYEVWNPLYSTHAVVKFQCKIPYLALTWTYNKIVKLESTSNRLSEDLKIDPDILELVRERLPEKEEEVEMQIHAGLFHKLVEEPLAYADKTIKLTREDLDEMRNNHQKPRGDGLQSSITSAYRTASGLDNSIHGFDANILGGIIEYVKKGMMHDEEFRNMIKLKKFVDLVDGSYLDVNWAVGALLMSFHEANLKKFFKIHFPEIDLNNKSYDDVLKELKKLLDKYSVSYNERDFALLKGERNYRHAVIHEGHMPEDSDLQEILKTTARMMAWIAEIEAFHLSRSRESQK